MSDVGSPYPAQDQQAAQARIAWLERELGEARQRERVLIGELQHRVRNMLATVRSIFTRTVESGADLDHVTDHFSGRIGALARYQLPMGVGSTILFDMEAIVRDELIVFATDNRLGVTGPEVRIPHRTAEAMALAVHELATNSIKFGVLGDAAHAGLLTVEWELVGSRLAFRWEESGIAVIASAPMRHGFGREYIEEALPYQLDAKTSWTMVPGGVRCTIDLPLSGAASPTDGRDPSSAESVDA